MTRSSRAIAGLLAIGLATAAWRLARPVVDYYSEAAVYNADSTAVRVSLADTLDPSAELIAPRAMGRRWSVEVAHVSVDRDVAGADPLTFDLRESLSLMGGDYVLAIRNTTMYVVLREDWPRTPPDSESALRALALVALGPLD